MHTSVRDSMKRGKVKPLWIARACHFTVATSWNSHNCCCSDSDPHTQRHIAEPSSCSTSSSSSSSPSFAYKCLFTPESRGWDENKKVEMNDSKQIDMSSSEPAILSPMHDSKSCNSIDYENHMNPATATIFTQNPTNNIYLVAIQKDQTGSACLGKSTFEHIALSFSLSLIFLSCASQCRRVAKVKEKTGSMGLLFKVPSTLFIFKRRWVLFESATAKESEKSE